MNEAMKSRLVKVATNLAPDILQTTKNLHFSFILKQSKIVSIGWNHNFKTHPFAQKLGYRYSNIHSELDSIKRLGLDFYYRDCILVNVRIMRDLQTVGLAKPCPVCGSWLCSLKHPFKAIYYTDFDQNMVEWNA
jgi:hypothetical protein